MKAVTVRSYSLGFGLSGAALWWGLLKIVMERSMGLILWLVMLALVVWRVIGVRAERRLCRRRVGRSPLEDDLRRFGVPVSSEAMSWKTLERLRVAAIVGRGTGVSSSADRCKVNLRVGKEPGIGVGSLALSADGTIETPDDLFLFIFGDGSGVSNG